MPSEVDSIGGTAHISLSAGAVGTAGAEAVVGMTGAGSFGMSCSRSWARVSSSPRIARKVSRDVQGAAQTGATTAPIGVFVVEALDTALSFETCEELFTPASPHIAAGLNGAEIFTNGSGSHHRLRKLDQRVDLVRNASAKSGGVYLYANQRGCDGGRLYFDGSALVAVNGAFVAQGPQFALGEVDVVTAVVDLAG